MKVTLIFVFLFIVVQMGLTQNENNEDWWKSSQFFMPYKSETAKKLPLISVSGNKFVNSHGNTILFHKVAISDPDKLANQGHWTKKHFEKIKEMGAMMVRIPIHLAAWR